MNGEKKPTVNRHRDSTMASTYAMLKVKNPLKIENEIDVEKPETKQLEHMQFGALPKTNATPDVQADSDTGQKDHTEKGRRYNDEIFLSCGQCPS